MGERPTTGTRIVAAVCLLAGLALELVAIYFLFMAYVLADSEADEVPVGFWEELVWFVLPTIAVLAAGRAVYVALGPLAEGTSLRGFAPAAAATVLVLAAFYGYAVLLTSG